MAFNKSEYSDYVSDNSSETLLVNLFLKRKQREKLK